MQGIGTISCENVEVPYDRAFILRSVGSNLYLFHYKSIVDKKTWMDLPMRYQPYDRRVYGKLLKLFLK